MDMRYKPSWLPQVSAPFAYTLDMLKKEGVNCKYIQIDPNELNPTQGVVALDKISNIDPKNIKPIWLSIDNEVLDGHHRMGAALSHSTPIRGIQLQLPHLDAVRVLNKIQDIYEYENQEHMVEVVAQNQINAMNEPDINFLEALDSEMKDDQQILHDDKPNVVGKKMKKQNGYRKTVINKKSTVGNFFSIKPTEGYLKYEIEFNNLLDTNDIGLTYYNGNSPVFILAKAWFPHIDFDKVAKKHNVSPDILINRAVAEKAKKLGYDGIKYGDIMIQGLN